MDWETKGVHQVSFDELAKEVYGADSEDYSAFVGKFKPKRTTDDCYTPPDVYEVVLKYCVDRYGVDCERVVRPFYPGGDYERYDYPADCWVIDNPPFSIITQIVQWYQDRGIRFFLFSPYLTNFSTNVDGVTHICVGNEIEYANGARVKTCFLTNMERGILARTDAKLANKLKAVNREKKLGKMKQKYKYPDCVLTITMLGYLATNGIDYSIKASDATFIRKLDAQTKLGKAIYGAGYLISESAAAEMAAAERAAKMAAAERAAAERAAEMARTIIWTLSDRERDIVADLGGEVD